MAIDRSLIDRNDLGVAQMGQYQYAAAFDSFTEVLEVRPDLTEVQVNLAIATLNKQDPGGEQATLELLAKVLEENPTHIRALYTSGIVHLYLGNPEETIDYLQRVVDVDPNDSYATYFLGQAFLQTEDYDRAKQWFLRTIEIDEYLTSAYWAASTSARRLRDAQTANELVKSYETYSASPLSKTAGIAYKQMGPKAEAAVISETQIEPTAKPLLQDIFQNPEILAKQDVPVKQVVLADSDRDRDWDIHYMDQGCVRTLENHEDGFRLLKEQNNLLCVAEIDSDPMLQPSIHWGDLSNNAALDILLCGDNGVVSFTTDESGSYVKQQLSEDPCGRGVLFDADHDSDLDFLFLSGNDAKLINNNLDGTYSDISSRTGLDVASNLVDFTIADVDADRDLDIVTIDGAGELSIWFNQRAWSYKQESVPVEQDLTSAVLAVADVDSDGYPNILIGSGSDVYSYQYRFDPQVVANQSSVSLTVNDIEQLLIEDFDGDGTLDLLALDNDGYEIYSPTLDSTIALQDFSDVSHIETIYTGSPSGPSLLASTSEGIFIQHPNPTRGNYLAIELSGKTDADQLRSNSSGIGTNIRARVLNHWTLINTLGRNSGAGQSLQPISIGLGDSTKANFIELVWSDGVTQSEIDLQTNTLHTVTETQRQLASCPVVFVWNGEKYEFLSDVLGVAALGYFRKVGVNAPYRDFERILVPESQLQPNQGYFEIKIGEPMEEVLYLDAAYIDVYDVPATHRLAIDERLHVKGDSPSGNALVYRDESIPVKASLKNQTDVTTEVLLKDRVAPALEKRDPNFIGLLQDTFELTLEFGTPLQTENAVLLVDGWVEFPYSQTVFAASQSGRSYDPPDLEIRLENGSWTTFMEDIGYPAGMPKQMSLPLPTLPPNVTAIRLTTNMEVYWDQVRIVYLDPTATIYHERIEPAKGYVYRNGYAKRTTGPQRVPYYNYDDRSPFWDSKYATGLYTRTGEVTELIESVDNALAIIGTGEEVHLKFPDFLAPPRPGYQRNYVLDFRGWAKDMDLYTENGHSVEPLPSSLVLNPAERAHRARLHERYNTRFEAGFGKS